MASRKKATRKKSSKKTTGKKKVSAKSKAGPTTTNDKPLTLDDVVIALQKTFSRVSARTGQVPEQDAQATITGRVDFELGVKVNPDSNHALLPDPQGSIELKLKGGLDTDVRYESDDEKE